ncbi:MAG: hypothetical protein GPOALKHO_000712 [Sodalis sp.]|uniref:hypothetical protein n=1 Tax=Sodalis sp. (in: enterobacteria) TaxID=1898979 RepID=UPI0038731BB4|nr:MAG: hypothetical protein GPOALKHO_000712 [Sodalis sp.]
MGAHFRRHSNASALATAHGRSPSFAKKIRQKTGLMTFVGGMITEPEEAETIIANSDADATCWPAVRYTIRANHGM